MWHGIYTCILENNTVLYITTEMGCQQKCLKKAIKKIIRDQLNENVDIGY